MIHPVYLWKCSKDEKKCSKNTLEMIDLQTNPNNSDTTDLKLELDGASAMQMKPMAAKVLVFITKGATFPIILYNNIV